MLAWGHEALDELGVEAAEQAAGRDRPREGVPIPLHFVGGSDHVCPGTRRPRFRQPRPETRRVHMTKIICARGGAVEGVGCSAGCGSA